MKSYRIITGGKGQGKTSYLLSRYQKMEGFVTIHRGEEYFLRSLKSGREELLFTRNDVFPFYWRGWSINQLAFDRANQELKSMKSSPIVLDEVGMLELEGRGFFPFLESLESDEGELILSVRREYVERVRNRFFPSSPFSIISI